jgi:hypothetical protein
VDYCKRLGRTEIAGTRYVHPPALLRVERERGLARNRWKRGATDPAECTGLRAAAFLIALTPFELSNQIFIVLSAIAM